MRLEILKFLLIANGVHNEKDVKKGKKEKNTETERCKYKTLFALCSLDKVCFFHITQ